jgi:hypothetical protein
LEELPGVGEELAKKIKKELKISTPTQLVALYVLAFPNNFL